MASKDEERFLHCACFGEGLHVQWDAEDGDFYVSLWTTHHGRPWLLDQIRHIWRILIKGRPYDDQIVLKEQEAVDLATFIKLKSKGHEERKDGE